MQKLFFRIVLGIILDMGSISALLSLKMDETAVGHEAVVVNHKIISLTKDQGSQSPELPAVVNEDDDL